MKKLKVSLDPETAKHFALDVNHTYTFRKIIFRNMEHHYVTDKGTWPCIFFEEVEG
jgi:hypothetical protein